jgi:hypothetical protein
LETVDALRGAGHECVEIEQSLPLRHLYLVIPNILADMTPEATIVFLALTCADGLETLLEPLNGDPLVRLFAINPVFLPTNFR